MDETLKKDNSKKVIAWAIIGIGVLALMKQLSELNYYPFIYLENIVKPLNSLFHKLWNFIFSWPVLLMFVGAVLMAGKRTGGLVLFVVGSIFALPKLFAIFSINVTPFLFPLILVSLGIYVLTKHT